VLDNAVIIDENSRIDNWQMANGAACYGLKKKALVFRQRLFHPGSE
jgi:hypothetical protein